MKACPKCGFIDRSQWRQNRWRTNVEFLKYLDYPEDIEEMQLGMWYPLRQLAQEARMMKSEMVGFLRMRKLEGKMENRIIRYSKGEFQTSRTEWRRIQ